MEVVIIAGKESEKYLVAALRPRNRRLVLLRRWNQAIQNAISLGTMPLEFLTSLRRFKPPNRLFVVQARNVLTLTARTQLELLNANPTGITPFALHNLSPIRAPILHDLVRIELPDLELVRHRPILVHDPEPLHLLRLRRRWRKDRRRRRRSILGDG